MLRSYLLPPHVHEREFRPHRAALTGALPAPETVASYLNKRLAEIGCKYVQAIPGDYIAPWVETLDDPGINAGLVRVHPNNEMLATYAADGYGRAVNGKTVGCVSFTYGVGSLNAVQAMAGAYVESVPVVMVCGTPSQAQFNSQRDQGVLWHHMFDGSLTDLRVLREVTTMAVRLDNPTYAPDLIDAVLTACITDSRPVYIEMSVGLESMACAPVAGRRPLEASPLPQNMPNLDDAVGKVVDALKKAKKLVVVGGVEIARADLREQFVELLKALKAPYLSDLLGKSVLSEYRDDILFSGVYNGLNSQKNVQDLMLESDMILMIGVRETDFNFTGLASAEHPANTAAGLPLPMTGQIEARMGALLMNPHATPENENQLYWGDIELGLFITELTKRVRAMDGLPNAAGFPRLKGSPWEIPVVPEDDMGKQVTWDSFKSLLQHEYLDGFTDADAPVVLADTGLTFYSLNNIKVPENGYIAQLSWGAIGYSPGAASGVQLALDANGIKRRVISISGDGAFAESANALGSFAELGQDCVIFVMANGVFAVEQFLVNAQAFSDKGDTKFVDLCRVAQTSLWDWKKLAEGFGGIGYEVTTNQELADVLRIIGKGSPPPVKAHGPCDGGGSTQCCDFADEIAPPPRRSTFTLVAVRSACRDLPSNTRWKLGKA